MTTTNRLLFGSHAGPLGANDGSFVLGITTVTLTDAQIKALPDSDPEILQIIPAPGVGKRLQFVAGSVRKRFVTEYTIPNGGSTAMYFIYDTDSVFADASLRFDDPNTSLFLTLSGDGVAVFPAGQYAVSGTSLENLNLGFTIDCNQGVFTGGDPSNTLDVTVLYTIVDV